MKKSILHLPRRNQKDLNHLVTLIQQRIPQTQMIILYGSYATGNYVVYDERVEFGIPTSYLSDYDILVVTHGAKDKEVGSRLDNVEDLYHKDSELQPPVQFINEDIKALNKSISEGRYFYTQLKREGIMLYDSGNFKLARRRKLNFDEIQKQAEEYFEEKYQNAFEFFESAKFTYSKEWYRKCAFYLHQTSENLFYAVRLVYTLQSNKQHNFAKLISSVRKYSPEFEQIFHQRTKEEKHLFQLIKAAYVEARYNPQFVVTREDCEALIGRVEKLSELVQHLCRQRIEEYGQMTE